MSSVLSPPSSGSLRKKRNFKALQLPTSSPHPPSNSDDPSSNANADANSDLLTTKKRPPALGVVEHPTQDGSSFHGLGGLGDGQSLLTPESSTTQKRNLQRTITDTLEKMKEEDEDEDEEDGDGDGQGGHGVSGASGGSGSGGGANGSGTGANGASGTGGEAEKKPRKKKKKIKGILKQEDLKNLEELGMGNGGSVMKVVHEPTGIVMAKKIVLIDAKPSIRKQILRELKIMNACDSPYIVSSYGAFLSDPNICICMEYMDRGSFDSIYKRRGKIEIGVVKRVAESVLEGLMYLYDVHHIIHRDIKPSNILLNSAGEIKLCDFGVSGELVNSFANTFVGTSVYMSPERIQGAEYSVKSDVWSLGITLIELAHGRFPFYEEDEEDDSDLQQRDYELREREGGGGRERPLSQLVSVEEEEGGASPSSGAGVGSGVGGTGVGAGGGPAALGKTHVKRESIGPEPTRLAPAPPPGGPRRASQSQSQAQFQAQAQSQAGSREKELPLPPVPTNPNTNGNGTPNPTLSNTNINTPTASVNPNPNPNRTSLVVPSPSPCPSPLLRTPRSSLSSSRRKSKGVSLHGGGMTMSIIELMHQIVQEPAPKLIPRNRQRKFSQVGRNTGGGKEKEGVDGKEGFPLEADEFVDACLEKDVGRRRTPRELLGFRWIVGVGDGDKDTSTSEKEKERERKREEAKEEVKRWVEGV